MTVTDAIQSAFSTPGEVAAIEVGPTLACALYENGEVRCLSTVPAPERPSASDYPRTPMLMSGLKARALSVGGSACAITLEDAVVCWGFIAQTAMFPACEVVETP